MPRSGGTYTPPTNSWSPAINGTLASTADWQALLNDIVAALTQSVSKDGQTVMTGSLDMGGFNLSNVASAAITALTGTPTAPTAAPGTNTTQIATTAFVADGLSGKQDLDADLTAIAGLSSGGLIARTGSGTAAARTLTAGAGISISDGDGVAGNPTISVDVPGLPNSSALISYVPAGTGADTTTVQAKLREVVSVADFGAVGDGVTDDTTALQEAVTAACAVNAVLHFISGKTYVITTKLTGDSNLRIQGNGATLDMTGVTGTRTGIEVAGSAGSGQAITSGASLNSYTVLVASTSAFAVGDYVQVSSSDNYDYGGGSYNVNRGEIVQIRSMVANTSISFTTPLVDTYTTSPVVRPITWESNVHIRGLKVVGADQTTDAQRGIALRYVRDFSVQDCELVNQNTYQIEIASCIRGRVSINNLTGVFYDGVTGTIFYGIAIMDGSQWIDVSGNIGNRNRHLVITTARTSGQGFYGQPRWINVRGNIMHDAMSGAAGRSFAFENHGFGQFISWVGNTANGCYSLIRLEQGTDNIVANNVCNGYGYQGIIVGETSTKIRNLVIANNVIKNYTAEVTAGSPAGIRFETSAEMINVCVNGNTFERVSSGSTGVGMSIGTSTTMASIQISNNVIRSGDAESTGNAISVAACTGINFANNVLYGFRAGYSLATGSSSIIVHGGRVENFSTGGTGFGFYANGSKCVCTNVHFKNINTAIRLDTASANCLTTANTMDTVTTTTPSNAGTANTTTGNFVL